VAAATAWWVASALLGHQRPFFAPVAAVVALGVSYAARLRRVGEVVAGVALGVAVGDVFVLLAGTGTWQIALVIAVAMSLAVLLNAGPMLITQAGVQAAIVTTLVPATAAGLDRWLDAVVGGAVALVAAAVVPTSPLRRPRRLAAGLLDDLADVLMAAANSARHRDPARAGKALQRARQTQTSLDELSDAAQEGLDVLQVSPFRRRHRRGVQDIWSIAEPLDRGVRAVLRAVVSATPQAEPLPAALLDLVEQLSSACALLATDLAAERPLDDALDALDAVAHSSATVPRSSLPGDVILAQVQSTVVDLLQVAGLDLDESLARVPPRRGQPPRR
jgi:uncharacterized membrane protein YgaE (UPF0421/DUF939 family)